MSRLAGDNEYKSLIITITATLFHAVLRYASCLNAATKFAHLSPGIRDDLVVVVLLVKQTILLVCVADPHAAVQANAAVDDGLDRARILLPRSGQRAEAVGQYTKCILHHSPGPRQPIMVHVPP